MQRTLEEYVRAGIAPARMLKILEKVVAKAERGEAWACKLLLQYTLNKPTLTDEGAGTDKQNGIVIRIENATFAAKREPQQVIEGNYSELREASKAD